MATYFSNLTSQGDVMQTQYLQNSKLTPYQSSDLPHNIMYMNPSSTVAAASLPELLPANSLAAHNYVEAQSVDNREEMLFMAPSGNPVIMQPMDRQLDVAASFSGSNAVMVDPQSFAKNLIQVQNADLNLQHQGLSLSLGNHVPSSVQMPSYHNPYTNSGITSLLTAQVDHPDEHGSQSSELKKAEYFSFDLTRPSNSSVKNGSLYDPQPSISPKAVNSDSRLHDGTVVGGMVYGSKYVKAVQELLDEVVNVHEDLKQQEKHRDFQSFVHDISEETKLRSSCQSGMPSDPQKSLAVSIDELSPTERNELHNKMTKLLSMLDEVDRRYRQYYQQMQVVASSFEIVAGCGAARRYTALALRTISRQFRCLRDAIKKQIQAVQQSLGEQGNGTNGQGPGLGLSRLRFVDQQVRQQRNLQQFGVLRQPWRPQRGLPETAVSVLRAWLFEHFLHPYPKDNEKIMLARQTGLSRSQVANWFINARVRLWKPMIEEMYKDEFGDVEGDSKSSELGQAVARWKSESEDAAGEEFHESSMSVTADGIQMGKSEVEVKGYTTKFSFQDGAYEEEDMGNGSNQTDDDRRLTAAAVKAYDFSMLGGGVGAKVSLALGLQHSETDPLSGRTQSGGDGTAASVGIVDKGDYYCVDAINQQDRFSSPHLLPDFVV